MWTFGVILLSLVAFTGCGGERDSKKADRPRLAASATLGIAGLVDFERWNVLRVNCANSGADFDGVLEVRGLRFSDDPSGDYEFDAVRYRVPVTIPSGEGRNIDVPVHPIEWRAMQLRFSQRGFKAEFEAPLSGQERQRGQILVVSSARASFRPLRSWAEERFRLFERAVRGADATIHDDEVACRIASVEPVILPDISMAYAPCDFVVLHDTQLRRATETARQALTRWIERGGIVLVLPGTTWFAGLDELFGEFVGVRRMDDGFRQRRRGEQRAAPRQRQS